MSGPAPLVDEWMLHARQAAAGPGAQTIQFTEMLPTPDQCWLTDSAGNRYAAELRLVAIDTSRR